MAGFELVSVAPITMHRTNRLANMYLLSPYVWADGDAFNLLVRAVPRRDDEPRLKMAEIWHGTSSDGCHFDMEVAPTIYPGADLVDLDGCEDPTVHIDGAFMRVWYTGYNEAQKTGRLLLARGPDVGRLAKAGLAIDSTPDFTNPKESTIFKIDDDHWRMYFEYAQGGASLIGQATTDHLDGPWWEIAQAPLTPRDDSWDCWHLSPGPVLGEGTDAPIMFYNGATHDAKWRIGWAVFDRAMTCITGRCADPLLSPMEPIGDGSTDIAFAASAIERDGEIWLYYSQSDQDLRRATLRRKA